jgi:hypothetical protein
MGGKHFWGWVADGCDENQNCASAVHFVGSVCHWEVEGIRDEVGTPPPFFCKDVILGWLAGDIF